MCSNKILNYKELAAILKISPETMRKNWRSYPHFFVGRGKDLRSARFDGMDVLSHLKKGTNNEQVIEIPNEKWREPVPGQIQLSGQAGGQRGIHLSEGRTDMGKGRAKAAEGRSGKSSGGNPDDDPFDLYRLVK